MRIAQEDDQRLEALLPWALVNIGRLTAYLLAASVASSLVLGSSGMREADRSVNEIFDWSVIYFFSGGLICLPGTALWLIIVARLSPELSTKKRRLISAIIAPPLIGLVFLLVFVSARGWLFALAYGLMLPAGSALVIRLRGFWRPSRFEKAY
ncbi:MAG TPA: hypothetical protein VFA25_10305 [Actinomycetota bacterium]|jgi:hypothetical protein|nr:hypothetical protein [Actinomycetota bacterium]